LFSMAGAPNEVLGAGDDVATENDVDPICNSYRTRERLHSFLILFMEQRGDFAPERRQVGLQHSPNDFVSD